MLGSEREVAAGNVRDMANEHNFVFCATKWIGLSEEDIGNAVSVLGDLSRFPTIADRLQQGILDTLFLGRLMTDAGGFVSNPAFQGQGTPVIDTRELFFDGNSQGGIMGGAATAVAKDWTRAVLGVPAMNYSTLLQRSIDWDTYKAIFDPAYPDPTDHVLTLGIVQMLWDRGEANGYAQHLTRDPYPDTPKHRCSCTRPSATTRSRTWPPRSRPAPSAPGCTAPRSPPAGPPPAISSGGWRSSRARTTARRIVVWDSGCSRAARRQRRAPGGRGPARRPARVEGSAGAEVRVPEAQRPRRRRVRRPTVQGDSHALTSSAARLSLG